MVPFTAIKSASFSTHSVWLSKMDHSNQQAKVPKHNRTYCSKEYWEERFTHESDYEWLLSYQQLAPQLQRFLQHPTCRILILGCGNAPFSADLYDAGYHQIVNIDYSENVIALMKERHEARPEMEWRVMDMTDMSLLPDKSFDVVIDKAAMDAILTQEGDVWNPNDDVIQAARAICTHVSRILKDQTGVFVQISLAQPHFRKKYLLGWHGNADADTSTDSYCKEYQWSLEIEKAGDNTTSDCFGHYLYVMRKR